MESRREILLKAYERLTRVKGEYACEITRECGIADLTIKQIEYLKIMDAQGDLTFSRLAGLTGTSKPTISELVNKLIRLDCVYKERSPDDRRVSFIYLTRKGKDIAQVEKISLLKVVDRILGRLNSREVDVLITLFTKVIKE